MTLAQFDQGISYLIAGATGLMLLRLARLGALRKYSYLFGYFLADILQTALEIGAKGYSPRYGYVFFAGEAVKVLLSVVISVRLWLLALRDYPALALMGRRVAVYLLGCALVIAAGGLKLEPPLSPLQNPFGHYFYAFEGTLDSAVVVFLVSATLFLVWFPVRAPRNVALLIGGLVFYQAQNWASLLIVNLYPEHVEGLSAVILGCELACLIFWLCTIRRAGEAATMVVGHRWDPAETERLLGQLSAINNRLQQISG